MATHHVATLDEYALAKRSAHKAISHSGAPDWATPSAQSDDVISPFLNKPKGMHSDTFYRLELRDFQANIEKKRIFFEQISALEAEE